MLSSNVNASQDASRDLKHQLTIWRGFLTVLHMLAIFSASYRIHRRFKIRQLWWDDYLAILCLSFESVYFPTLWLRAICNRELLVAATWISQVFNPLLIWYTRVSLSLSIARFAPPKSVTQKASIWFAVVCGMSGPSISIATIIGCKIHGASWDTSYPYQCPLSVATIAYRIAMESTADLVLVIIPFLAFWRRLSLPQMTRRLVLACFSASLITFCCCFISSSVLFGTYYARGAVKRADTGLLASVFAHLMASISLLVCNTLVVVTSIYRYFRAPDTVDNQIGHIVTVLDTPQTRSTEETESCRNNPSYNSPHNDCSESSSSMHSQVIELTNISDSQFTDSVIHTI